MLYRNKFVINDIVSIFPVKGLVPVIDFHSILNCLPIDFCACVDVGVDVRIGVSIGICIGVIVDVCVSGCSGMSGCGGKINNNVLLLISNMTFQQGSPYYTSIMKARDWKFADIQKSIDLEPKGAPNILIALGLSCYTEYWGKLLLGFPKENSKKCYEEFLKCLGDSYKPNPYRELLNKELPIYEDVRCGLVHAYAIPRDCAVNLGEGDFGISYDEIKDHYDFNIKTYFTEFKCAVDAYIERLENGKDILKMNNAMKGKPR